MSYNLLSGSVNFEGSTKGTIEDVVDTHTTQTISGQKTISNLSSSTTHVTTRLQVGGSHLTDHAVSVTGDISASVNISASAFYGDGSNLSNIDQVVTAMNNKVENRLVTIGATTTELDGEASLTFQAGTLTASCDISGSGNISGSQFYGEWAGQTISATKISLAAAGGLGNGGGNLTLDIDGVPSQNSPAGTTEVFTSEGGTIKVSTISNIFANNAAVTSAGSLSNTQRVLLAGGTGTIQTHANLNYYGGVSTLSVTGAISASSDLDVGGTLDVAGNSVFLGDVEIGGTLSGGSPLNISGAVNFISSSFNSSGSWVHTGSFFQSGSGNTFSIMDNVGIGTTSPTATLEISSSNDPQFKISHPTAGSNARFTMAANGDLTINPNGATTIDSSLTINGNTVLGDNSADTLTIAGTAVTCNNGLNFDSNTLFISSSNDRVGIGTITPDSKLQVNGAISGSTLTGSALQLDNYITHAGDSNTYFGFGGDDLVAFIAGGVQMLTNYGNLSPKRVQVGGSDFRVNTSGLDFQINNSDGFVGIGDTSPTVPLQISSSNSPQFEIVYNGSNKTSFEVNSVGNLIIDPVTSLTLKGDLIIKDGNEDTKTIVQIFDNQDDGLIAGYEEGSKLTFLLHGNGTSYFSGSNQRLAVGTINAAETFSVSGSFQASGSHVRARLKDSIFQISSSITIQSGGQALFEVMSPTNSSIFGVTEGGVIASNIQPAGFDANLYISGAAVIGAPTAVVPDANLHSGSVSFFLDEGNNKLKFRIRYSTGAMKTGEINLS